ncbi:MAG: glycoside hydrolase family 32 protein [Bacilli bacterium]|nr:glycoside hydrolase family 32 protein [Bacilli bacterium]
MTVAKATEFVQRNKDKVKQEFRLKYHGMPEVGWMNDPNGFSYFLDSYHIFYQYYPYDSVWGTMHWGHMVSKDLVKFDYLPVALAPDQEDESGCFSGGAIVDQNNNTLHLFYTKHLEKNGEVIQTQGLASSSDGVNFIKRAEPIITKEMVKEHAKISDVRDPYPIYINGWYYVILGAKGYDDKGKFLIFRSKDLQKFTFHGEWKCDKCFGLMVECPDLKTISNSQLLLFSRIYKDENMIQRNESRYIVGQIDLEVNKYEVYTNKVIDRGHHFYAPQSMVDNQGRTILIAWMDMWGDKTVTHDLGHYWQGALTFPRVLTINDGELYQYPIEELKKYRKDKAELKHIQEIEKQVDIETKKTNKPFTIDFCNPLNENEFYRISYDGKYISVDGKSIKLNALPVKQSEKQYDDVTLRILVDTSSIEIFVNEGVEVFTSRVYMRGSTYLLQSSVEGEIYTIKVDD